MQLKIHKIKFSLSITSVLCAFCTISAFSSQAQVCEVTPSVTIKGDRVEYKALHDDPDLSGTYTWYITEQKFSPDTNNFYQRNFSYEFKEYGKQHAFVFFANEDSTCFDRKELVTDIQPCDVTPSVTIKGDRVEY
ncbi:hypothetical protein [Reichenbachiella versicolor]|uniref:hypothetical protein n=1 Tax=Reichenbachiella versicolor TaxID=1821036 RepID=UPI000D6E415A|nr:hypothetical protein [Reichenbachiella versicolor]